MNPQSSRSPPRISCKGWSLENILALSNRIKPITRINVLKDQPSLFAQIALHESKGEPLVIQDFHTMKTWRSEIFTPEWFIKNSKSQIVARNVHTWQDETMATRRFFEMSRKASPYITEGEDERWYAKDVPCPDTWMKFLRFGHCPQQLLPHGTHDYMTYESVDTIMCYFGVGDTATPTHKDLCASSGQNLMVYTEKDGSSFWFMTRSGDSREAAEFFHTVGFELDHENGYLTPEILAKAPIDIFVTEQKLGDFVMVPPRSCHQVVNNGGLTMKVSWSRMTLSGLTAALYHELPLYQRVCRPETYRIKSMIHLSLIAATNGLSDILNGKRFDGHMGIDPALPPPELALPYAHVVSNLVELFADILADECPPSSPETRIVPTKDDRLACDFCAADIFHSCFECSDCGTGDSAFTLCVRCYLDGRSCACRQLSPVQIHSFDSILEPWKLAIEVLTKVDSQFNNSHFSTRFSDEHERFEASKSKFGLFRSACLLYTGRDGPKKTRACAGSNPSHQFPVSDGLFCKCCHNGRCYTHILDKYHVHSSIGIYQHHQDPSHQIWHQLHQKSRKDHDKDNKNLATAQKNGARPDVHSNLSWVAKTFRNCQPINAKSRLGWYDHPIEGLSSNSSAITGEEEVEETHTPATESSEATPISTTTRRKRKGGSTVGARSKKKRRASTSASKVNDTDSSDEEKSDSTPLHSITTKSPDKLTELPIKRAESPSISLATEEDDDGKAIPARFNRKSTNTVVTDQKTEDSMAKTTPVLQLSPVLKNLRFRKNLDVETREVTPPSTPLAPRTPSPAASPPPSFLQEEHPPAAVPQANPPTLEAIKAFTSDIQAQIESLRTELDTTLKTSGVKTQGQYITLRNDIKQVQERLESHNTVALPTTPQEFADLARRTLSEEECTVLVNLLQPPALPSPAIEEERPKSPEIAIKRPPSPDIFVQDLSRSMQDDGLSRTAYWDAPSTPSFASFGARSPTPPRMSPIPVGNNPPPNWGRPVARGGPISSSTPNNHNNFKYNNNRGRGRGNFQRGRGNWRNRNQQQQQDRNGTYNSFEPSEKWKRGHHEGEDMNGWERNSHRGTPANGDASWGSWSGEEPVPGWGSNAWAQLDQAWGAGPGWGPNNSWN